MTTITDVISFWDNRPCNIAHSDKEVGSKEYFQEVSQRKYFVEPHIIPFANFEEWRGKKVLEIGCGIGTAAQSFAEAGAIYTGVDISKKSLELARKRFDVFGLDGYFYQVEDEELSSVVPLDEYDLVYSFGVIHHTPDPKKAIEQIYKYMSNDSEFRLMLYSKFSFKNLMIKLRFDRPEAQKGCPTAYKFSFKEIRQLLKDFEILSIRKDHIFPFIIKEYINYRYKKRWWIRLTPASVFGKLESILGWHTLIKCKKKELSREFPLKIVFTLHSISLCHARATLKFVCFKYCGLPLLYELRKEKLINGN